MKAERKERLKADGWQVGDTVEFLNLTPEEAEYIEVKLELAKAVREAREADGSTQTELAKRIGSSQSRVAKMEAADASVSVDLMVKTLFYLGVRSRDVTNLIVGSKKVLQ